MKNINSIMNRTMAYQSKKNNSRMKLDSVLMLLSFSVLAVTFLSGCDEGVLDTTPYGQTTSDSFWRTATDAEAAINAVYHPLPSHDLYGHTEMTLINIPSDDEFRAGDHGPHSDLENFTYDATHPYFDISWKNKYEIIQRTNDVLINVPEMEIDQNLKDRILGEAHFMRGFAYWTLAKLFAGVPLILEEDVLNGEYNKSRQSLENTYAQIEADFQEAANLLPSTHEGTNIGRPNSGTAWGYLSMVYMLSLIHI